MAAEDPIEPRVSALEGEAQQANQRLERHDARLDDLHSLASGTDRDVSAIMAKLSAHERSLQALHLDVRDLERKVDARFDVVGLRFEAIESEMRAGFAMMGVGFAAIGERLDRAFPDD